MIRRYFFLHADSAVAGLAAALGAWLLQPGLAWALLSFGLGALAALLAARSRRGLLLAAAAVGLIGATAAGVTSTRVRMVERRWEDVREQLIRSASVRLAATLETTVGLARNLADRGAAAAGESQPNAFDLLEEAVGRGGPEAGVVVLEADGTAWSWAGRHRMEPVARAGELNARITPFYVVLESRRQMGNRVSVGHVLVAADSAVPDRSRTVSARFTRSTRAALEFYAPGRAPPGTDVFDYCLPTCVPGPGNSEPDTLFTIRTLPPTQGAFKLALLDSGGRTAAVVILLTLFALMAGGQVRSRYLALALICTVLIFTPAGARLGLNSFFSPATYYLGALDPLTASAGALWLTAVMAISAVVALRTRPPPRGIGLVTGTVALLATPPGALLLARGIAPPAGGVGVGLWLGWEVPIALSIAALVLLVSALLPRLVTPRPLLAWAAAGWGVAAALLGLLVWRADAGWPAWYAWLWVPAVFLVAQSGVRVRQVVAGGLVAGCAAAILTWGAVADGRLRLARADAERLGGVRDPLEIALLERIGRDPWSGPPPRTAADLYALWYRSLASAGYPAVLAAWGPRGEPLAELALARLELPARLLQLLATSAAEHDSLRLEVYDRVPGPHAVLARPFADGSVLTVGVGPKTRLIPPFRIARLARPGSGAPAPYEMALSEGMAEAGWRPGLVWRREGQTVHGDERLNFPGAGGTRHLHVTVAVGELPALLIRGALVLFLNVGVTLLFWFLGEALLGRTAFAGRIRGLMRLRSYRLRIALALAVFFIVPTVGFSAWMAGRLRSEAIHSQDLVIRQSLRDASSVVPGDRGGAPGEPLAALADRIDAELLLYDRGTLRRVSAPVLVELGLIDAYLPPPVYRTLLADRGGEAIGTVTIAGRPARAGFRAPGTAQGMVLGMPRLAEERQAMEGGDLAYALLLVTLIGLGAAAALARAAARSLAEPVGVLRSAAETVGRGQVPAPFGSRMPEEFVPVADAFTRMAADVRASQAALEAARHRTVAVLRNVATGVVALSAKLDVTLANPRAEELLGQRLETGTPIGEVAGEWGPVWAWVGEFLRSGGDLAGGEFTVAGRRVRVQTSALGGEGGCVVALDDVTELAHAVRVLAWGEIARQVAHEIKNPLTPMRLGIQHLQRAHREPRGEFDEILERTSRQILAEIDRLDAVARAFSRFGAPPVRQEAGPLAPIDLVAVARETAALYALGGNSGVELETDGIVRGVARPDELREVLVNLVENARNAKASRIALAVGGGSDSRVRLSVSDNGEGIRGDDLPRIFEPHFSTTTSGTGLGLAICRRLVESWGGTIAVESQVGKGTVVTIEVAGLDG